MWQRTLIFYFFASGQRYVCFDNVMAASCVSRPYGESVVHILLRDESYLLQNAIRTWVAGAASGTSMDDGWISGQTNLLGRNTNCRTVHTSGKTKVIVDNIFEFLSFLHLLSLTTQRTAVCLALISRKVLRWLNSIIPRAQTEAVNRVTGPVICEMICGHTHTNKCKSPYRLTWLVEMIIHKYINKTKWTNWETLLNIVTRRSFPSDATLRAGSPKARLHALMCFRESEICWSATEKERWMVNIWRDIRPHFKVKQQR